MNSARSWPPTSNRRAHLEQLLETQAAVDKLLGAGNARIRHHQHEEYAPVEVPRTQDSHRNGIGETRYDRIKKVLAQSNRPMLLGEIARGLQAVGDGKNLEYRKFSQKCRCVTASRREERNVPTRVHFVWSTMGIAWFDFSTLLERLKSGSSRRLGIE